MKTHYNSMNIREECFPNTLPEKCGTHVCLSTNLNMFCTGIFLKMEGHEGGLCHLMFQ